MSLAEEEPFHSFYRETPIRAIVGESKAIFYVHPGALIQGKSALTARVTGPWKTAGQDTLDWSDFDEETVDCALKFCYAQKYIVPWELDPSKEDPTPQEPAPSSAEHNAQSGSLKTRRSYAGEAVALHAKIYSFAHRYLVDDLQHYALGQMKDCLEPFLSDYRSSPSTSGVYLIDAIRVIYGTTPRLDSSVMDPARHALCDFVAASHEVFRFQFPDLHKGTGEFMVDLATKLSQFQPGKGVKETIHNPRVAAIATLRRNHRDLL
ncbi:hypothetical protein PITC_095890 [Penicillium italicum]|uniref:BTB domain-containing protein n=1 Tax=Penicillium italicum TaxID=40296 RepID=A0A0A2KQM1_PENIT|nr:hypothetical protein PITC_095890 [Penicillium italicum]